MVVLYLRTVPSSAARCFASADFASLCVLEASAASRPPISHRAVFGGLVFRLADFASLCVLEASSALAASDEQYSLLIGLTSRCFVPQFAIVALLRYRLQVSASQFSMVAPHRSQAHSRCSLLHWAHRRLLQPPAAPPLSPSLDFRFACFAHCARPSCAPTPRRAPGE